jgi:RNA polymerase sigma factor (sigma-70 family)
VRVSRAQPAVDHEEPIVGLVPLIRRVVAARVVDPQLVDDLVQETLARVMAARSRVERDTLAPYAIVTARNLVASLAQREQRARSKAHLLLENGGDAERPEERTLRREEVSLVGAALANLPPDEREILLAHEVQGEDTATLAASRGSTPGAIAARLSRTRARLRVEYLLAQNGEDPPGERCRPILLALSAGDRRRQRELDVQGHLLECDFCAQLSTPLLERRASQAPGNEVRVRIAGDPDVVTARQKAREVAAHAGFAATDLTLIATAVSEIARNIVKFARRGELAFAAVEQDGRSGITITARDSGPGIADVGRALQDGYSTYRGLGLGLPGARRLMDEFEVLSEVGRGTTVTMTKWRR